MADQIVSWGGFNSKGTSGMGVTGSFQVSSSANSFFVGGGNVGIGTSNPTSSLDVFKNNAGNIQTGNDSVIVKGNNPRLKILGTSAGSSTGDGVIQFSTEDSGDRWVITGGGTFAIGAGWYNSNTSLFRITNSSGGNTAASIFLANADNDGRFALGFAGTNGTPLSGFTSTGKLYISSTGLATPSAMLQVKGSGTTSSTTALLVQNANASNMLSLTDNGALTINTFQTSSTAFTINRTYSTMGGDFNLATMGSLISINDTVGNSNTYKTTLYINSLGASGNNALIVQDGGVGFGVTNTYGNNFISAYFTTLAGLRVNLASDYQITSRDYTSRYNTSSGGGISFWGDASGQAGGQSAYAGIRGLKANNTYINPLGNLAFYVQTGSSSHVINEDTFREVGRFNELGSFGIGTATPIYNLEVSSTSYSGIGVMSGANNTAEISFQNRGYGLPRWTIRSGGAPDGSSGNLTFQRLASTFPVTITSNENLLVGTSTDGGARLQVKGSGTTSSTTALLVQNANSRTSLIVNDDGRVGINTAPYDAFALSVDPISGSTGVYVAQRAAAGSINEYRFGTTTGTPSAGNTAGRITWQTLSFLEGIYTSDAVDGYRTVDLLIQGWSGSVAETARFTYDNKVGIGTTSPSAKLHVAGNTIITGSLTVTGSLILSGSNVSTAWTSYTPTWTSDGTAPSLGNGTLTGAYKVIGKTCFVRVRLAYGSSTTSGTGAFYFDLPFSASAASGVQFPCSILDNGNAWYQATVNGEYGGFTNKTAIIGQSSGANSSQGITGTFPFTFGTSDSIQFNGSYEIA